MTWPICACGFLKPPREIIAFARSHLLIAFLLTLSVNLAAQGVSKRPTPHPLDDIPYNRWAGFACHNCFEPGSALGPLSRALTKTRAIEIDVWRGAEPGRWFVAHGNLYQTIAPRGVKNNDSNCHRSSKKRGDLDLCLAVVAAQLSADSDVVTIFIDIKDGWRRDWNPAALDATIRRSIGDGLLYTPSQRRAQAQRSTDRGSVWWPSLNELHGRIVVVLTGDNDLLWAYARDRSDAVAFIAIGVENARDVQAVLDSQAGRQNEVLFFNMGITDFTDSAARSRIAAVNKASSVGRISRLWQNDWLILKTSADRNLRDVGVCAHMHARLNFLAVYEDVRSLHSSKCLVPAER